MTDDLTYEARELFRQARDSFSPSAEDLARVRQRVGAALAGGSAVSALAIAKTTAVASHGGVGVATAIVVAIAAGGAGTWWATTRDAGDDAAPLRPAITAPSNPEPIRHIEQRAVAPRAELPPAKPLPKPPRTVVAPRIAVPDPAPVPEAPIAPTDSLEQEVALVRSADGALKAGDPTNALAIVRSAHVVQLVAELAAIEVDALCALGRRDEARVSATSFIAHWPRSALRARVTRSCAGGSK